jgi:Tfp pilus assembly protein PilE
MQVSARGITLSELLIATLIVSIMLIGIASTDFAIRRMDRDTHRDTSLYLKTLAVAEQYRQGAISAIGDATNPPNSLGIQIHNSQDNSNYVCFRHDDPNNPSPADYTDDTWDCLTRLNSAGTDVGTNVLKCQRTEPAYGFGACTLAGAPPDFTPGRFVGTMPYNGTSDAFTNDPPIVEPSFDLVAGVFHVQVIGRVDPTAGVDKANWPNGTDDNNLQTVIQVDVSPEAHGNN